MTTLAWLFLAAFLYALALLVLATMGNADLADELRRARSRAAGLALRLNESERDRVDLRRRVLLAEYEAAGGPDDVVEVPLWALPAAGEQLGGRS